MQFETKIVNGKPSIFFTNDQKSVASIKKVSTKDKNLTKKIRESLEINGELDDVKVSPRSQSKSKSNALAKQSQTTQNNVKRTDNSVATLNQDQLLKIITAIQSNGAQVTIDKNGKIKLLDTNRDNQQKQQQYDSGDEYTSNLTRSKKNKSVSTEDLTNGDEIDDNLAIIKGPKIVTNIEQDDEKTAKSIPKSEASKKESSNGHTLMDKKKQKWQAEKDYANRLDEQETNDRRRQVNNNNRKNNESNERLSVIPRTGHTPEPSKAPLSLAEKKRLQWQKEIEESSNSYRETKSRFSSYYNDYHLRRGPVAPYTYHSTTYKERDRMPQERPTSSQLKKSFSLENLSAQLKDDYHGRNVVESEKILSKLNIDSDRKSNLIDKKKQKWSNEISDQANYYNPFGRPGAGAPNKTQSHMNERMPSFNDQSKIPAAMRTSVMFGDVMFEDDIRKTKELERKRWLQELESQRRDRVVQNEMNREREKLSDRSPPPQTTAPQAHTREAYQQQQSNSDENKVSYARATNKLLDPAQIEDMERKKKANLQHKREIEAQIAEKKRLKNLEDELASLENLKAENEAKLMNLNTQKEVDKRKNLYEVAKQASETDKVASIVDQMQNDRVKSKPQQKTAVETDDIQKKILQAEYDAALEKHKKLLKKLQHGNHNTDKLCAKFNEFRAKCLAMGVNVGPMIGEESKAVEKKAAQKGPAPFNPYSKMTLGANRNKENQSVLKDEAINTIESSANKEAGIQTDQSRMRQLFSILREDTNGLPSEITEEQIKLLLKNVSVVDSKTKVLSNNKLSVKKAQQQKQQEFQSEVVKKGAIKERPLWGARKKDEKLRNIKNSEKDPFFKERLAYQEEKKNEQLNQLKSLIEQNNAKITKQKQQQLNDEESMDHFELPPQIHQHQRQTQMSNRSTTTQTNRREQETQGESILNLIPKTNGATKSIKTLYEVDEDELNSIKHKVSSHRQNRIILNDRDSDSSLSFVPFMRTDEFLNPAHATSPVPPSRESTATKQERDKARQAFYQNMKPGDYGKYYDEDRPKHRDPLLNKNYAPPGHSTGPSHRQENILSQLANLKQSLIQKQKEVASSIKYDNEDY